MLPLPTSFVNKIAAGQVNMGIGVAVLALGIACLAFSPAASAVVVSVETSEGRWVVGKVIRIADGRLELEAGDGSHLTFRLAELERLVVDRKASPAAQTAEDALTTEAWEVVLVGGSLLRCNRAELGRGSQVLMCQLAGALDRPHQIPLLFVDSILFRRLQPPLESQWDQLKKSTREADRLVVARQEFLDFYAGKILALNRERATFRMEGEELDVPVGRVVGLVLAPGTGQIQSARLGAVEHRGGSLLWAQELTATSQQLKVTVTQGLILDLDWQEVVSVDFGRHRQIALADLPVVDARIEPLVPLPGLEEPLARLLLPPLGRQDSRRNSGPGEVLLFPAGTNVVWSLAAEASLFRATLRPVSKLSTTGLLTVRIWADEQLLLERQLPVGQSESLELPLPGAKSLRLQVDAADSPGFGLFLEVRNGRVILAPN